LQTFRPGSFALTALLALLSAMGPFSIDVFLPSLPDMGRALNATPVEVQMTISLYLIGFAAGQIVYGPISDRLGRKPVLLAALATYCIATVISCVAPSIEVLIATRVVQGLGASGAQVLARAMVRDLYEGARAGREMSLMTVFMAVAPVIAPVVGGGLQMVLGWRAGFVVLLGLGLLNALLAWFFLPETLKRGGGGLVDTLRGFRIIGRSPAFLAYAILVMLSFGGLFAWVAGSPFVLQNVLDLTPLQFGVAYASASCGVGVGAFLATRVVTRLGLDRTAGLGVAIMMFGGAAMLATTAFGRGMAVTMPFAMALYLCGYAILLPQASVGAMMPFPDRAGSASSLVGVAQQLAAAVSGIIVSYMLGASAWPMAIAVAVCGLLALVMWALTRRIRTTRLH
jgi:DHA1 family bicyclomycin/chloramphenicol resistance-like MFS transporter